MEDRPRDRYGRPLAPGAAGVVPGVPVRDSIGAAQAWEQGTAFLAADLPFHAHEVFELRWRCCPDDERPAWRLCAQWAAALTHRARGNARGAHALAERTRSALGDHPTLPEPIDRAVITQSVAEILDET